MFILKILDSHWDFLEWGDFFCIVFNQKRERERKVEFHHFEEFCCWQLKFFFLFFDENNWLILFFGCWNFFFLLSPAIHPLSLSIDRVVYLFFLLLLLLLVLDSETHKVCKQREKDSYLNVILWVRGNFCNNLKNFFLMNRRQYNNIK